MSLTLWISENLWSYALLTNKCMMNSLANWLFEKCGGWLVEWNGTVVLKKFAMFCFIISGNSSNSYIKVVYPKYYEYLKKAVLQSHLGRWKMGWFHVDQLAHQIKPKILKHINSVHFKIKLRNLLLTQFYSHFQYNISWLCFDVSNINYNSDF